MKVKDLPESVNNDLALYFEKLIQNSTKNAWLMDWGDEDLVNAKYFWEGRASALKSTYFEQQIAQILFEQVKQRRME